MTSRRATFPVHSARPLVQADPALPEYVPLPQRLLTDLHDNPLAIGLYSLIARLYLIVQQPIVLSGPDILRYDPALSRGAIICALRRLIRGGWVIETAQPGLKTSYTPTWGRVKGAPLAWQMGTPCLGRPRHVMRLCLDRRLFDICMGKLTPHATRSAPITRYVTEPAVSLTDIGCYALTLAGIPRMTPALVQLGAVWNDQALPLPSDEGLLASLSQLGLLLDESGIGRRVITLTVSGTRRLGIRPFLPPASTSDRSQPLFFVPPTLIDTMIETMIDSRAAHEHRSAAPACHETYSADRPEGITWESRDSRDHGNPPLPPQHGAAGGGCSASTEKRTAGQDARRRSRRDKGAAPALPDTEAAQALRAINVLPAQIVALADLPLAVVTSAIRDGQARPYVRDLAAWVVTLLRAHRSHGWTISPPPAPADSVEAWRAAFAPYLPDPALDQDRSADGDVDEHTECDDALVSSGRADAAPAPAPDTSPTHLWREVLATMQLQVPRQEFQTWLRDTALHDLAGGSATVSVPSARAKAALDDRYLGALRDLLSELTGAPVWVRVVVRSTAQPSAPSPSAVQSPEPPSLHDSCASEDSERPEWISADRWDSLPRLLRAALRGATRAGEQVQGATPHLHALLQLRYQPQLAALLTDAEQAAHNGAPAAHSGRATRTV